MASEHGSGGCNKRYREASSCAEDDIGEMSKRWCGVAPSSGANDDGPDAYRDGCSDAYGGQTMDGDGEDYMLESDGSDEEDEVEKTQEDAPAFEEEHRYVVLTQDDIRARQEADTAKVAEVLSIPPGFGALLLRHFKWRVGWVQEEWFADGRRVRRALGLPAASEPLVPTARSPRPHACAICFDRYPAGQTRAASCSSHFYCDECWAGYIRAAVDDGPRCLSLRCPDPACPAPVVGELVDEVAGVRDRERYARFALRSYVEQSGGRVRWCPGPGCTRAVELIGDAVTTEVFCDCKHGFCWDCGGEAHRPVSCGTARAWLAKNRSDSETANWVVAYTKHCPRCRRPIEKNQGCNHMTCPPPCNHHFCWLCLKPAATPDHYACGAMDRPAWGAGGSKEEHLQREARASLDRYLYHYERWAVNRASLETALRDMAALERSELHSMAKALGLPATELGFVTEAYHQIAHGRRVLRWAHAYGYFLDPVRDAAKRALFDDLENQANRWLECLHGCAELERKELFGGAAIAADTYKAYRRKVANLTRVTRRFLDNLVRAFETDLPEVVKTAEGPGDGWTNSPSPLLSES